MYVDLKSFHKQNMCTCQLVICWTNEAQVTYNELQIQNYIVPSS